MPSSSARPPLGPRSVRSSGSLESVRQRRTGTTENIMAMPTTTTSNKRSLPASRSMPVVLGELNPQEQGAGSISFLGDITCVGSSTTTAAKSMSMSWVEYRSTSSRSTVLQQSINTSRRTNSSSSSSSSSTGSFSHWSGSNTPSPKLEDTARMEGPPAPWEQNFNSFDAQQQQQQQQEPDHALDHLAGLNRAMTLSSENGDQMETLPSPMFTASLLPPAPLHSSSAAMLYLGDSIASQPPSDPAHLVPGNRARRVPLAEIPLWYADVRGEAIRRGKHERSSLSNAIDFSASHILSTNTAHNIPQNDYYHSPSQSSHSSFGISEQQAFGNLSSIAENSQIDDGRQLFVLADDEPHSGGSPRRKEIRALRRKSISEQQPYPNKKAITSRGR
ncbi:hypothetical protein A4X09_0g1487 [Tilletia walkeri]|uniref:Uncharacterized protein n=1 Tax=Tilletia walkeri TaxID=117179 RepID=A0A8X7NF32_9BASI|nr:hypothetical protein A4X09_0g1487 [Tilletia walkeri]